MHSKPGAKAEIPGADLLIVADKEFPINTVSIFASQKSPMSEGNFGSNTNILYTVNNNIFFIVGTKKNPNKNTKSKIVVTDERGSHDKVMHNDMHSHSAL